MKSLSLRELLSEHLIPPIRSVVLSQMSPSFEVSSNVFVSGDLLSLPSQGLQPKRGLDWRKSFPRFLFLTFSPFPRSHPASFLCHHQQGRPDLFLWPLSVFFSASLQFPPLRPPQIFPSALYSV